MDDKESSGWITEFEGVGAWIQIFFHENIFISAIALRHNLDLGGKYRQNFKDVSVVFSDYTYINITLDNTFDEELRYKLTPPKLSSFLKLEVNSVYSFLTDYEMRFENGAILRDQNRYGLSTVRIYSAISKGNVTSIRLLAILLKHYFLSRILLKAHYITFIFLIPHGLGCPSGYGKKGKGYVHTCLNGSCPIPGDISLEKCGESCSNHNGCAFFKHNNLDKTSTCFLHGYNHGNEKGSDIHSMKDSAVPIPPNYVCSTGVGELCCQKGKFRFILCAISLITYHF